MNGIIEDATGKLLCAGYTDFSGEVGAGMTVRNDVPEPAYVRGDILSDLMHVWNGSAWTTAAQETVTPPSEASTLTAPDSTVYVLSVDNDGILNTSPQ